MSLSPQKWMVLGVVILMNILAYALMGIDKRRAKRHEWRIPEKTLFLFTLLGGGIGGTLGMWHFRHKTQHWYFRFGFPSLALIQVIGLIDLIQQ